MSRSLENILFGAPSPRAQAVTRAMSALAAAALLALATGIVYRFHNAGQLDARFWNFFAWSTTWSFLGKGLLGTMASAAMAAVIALGLGLVLMLGRLAPLRLLRWPSVAAIEFLRGTPTLLLIYVCFLVLPQVGIKYDPANWDHAGQDYLDVVRRHGDKVAHVHIKEHLNIGGELASQPAAGMGDIAFGKVLAFLYEHDYRGYLCFEPHGALWGREPLRQKMLLLTKKHLDQFLV